MPLSPGDRLGSYVIVGPLGAGGMGQVYKAHDQRLDRFVALKILHGSEAVGDVLRERFRREARTIASLSHPHIVTIHSIEEHGDVPFLTMELLDGRTLTGLISPGGASLATFLEIARPLADAVAAAHARGITHRDLKPGNVMLTGDGRLKVLDFGLAKLTEIADGPERLAGLPTEQLTSDGQILGTVAYMSPEQAEGRPVDHRSDIFSLGIMLHELATGTRPFAGKSTVAILSSILRDTPPLASELNPAIPATVARLIRRCLEKNPSQRFQSALDLKHDLDDIQTTPSGSTELPPVLSPVASDRRLRPSPLAVAGALVAVVAVAGAYAAWTRGAISTGAGTGTPAPGSPITVTRFENRTGDASLDSVGQMLTDALMQELPRLPEVMRNVGSGQVPLAERSTTTVAPGVVSGAYYLDGANIRIQPSLVGEAGNVLHAIEPAVGPRTDLGKTVDLAQQRILGAIVAALDRDLGKLSKPPLYSAYREYKAGMFLFADEPAAARAHLVRATEMDPGFFTAWYGAALASSNVGDVRRARELIDRMREMNDRWSAKERELVAFLAYARDGRLMDALKALRTAESQDPTDLSTNYLIGFYLLRLNRPQETIDQYAKVDAESWDAVTVGAWRYARLATANHLLGRHDEELRVARIARRLFPTSFLSRTDELVALAALGNMDDLRRAADDTQTMATRGTATPAASMRVAAEELRAHGYHSESIAMARAAVTWYRNRPADYLASAANRLLLAQSLYVAEDWAGAGTIASTLVREQPQNAAHTALAGTVAARMGNHAAAMTHAATLERLASDPGGLTELRRAQLSALLGRREQAVALFRDAFARGLPMSAGLHRNMDLESLRGFEPFDDLLKPKH